MSEPDSQAKACAQAGAQVDINVRVTTGGAAAAASSSAQPKAQRPADSPQPNIASFFGKRAAPKEPRPEMVGAPGRVGPLPASGRSPRRAGSGRASVAYR